MGLNRVSNPKRLRALSRRVGLPIIRAYARFFDPQTTLLAFSDSTTAWIVPRSGPVERYDETAIELLEYGVRTHGR